MTILPLSASGRWVRDARGEDRALRVSAHAEEGFLVLSTWRQGTCVGTVRLQPTDAGDLVAGLADALAQLAAVPALDTASEPRASAQVAERLRKLEERLARLELQRR